MPPRRSTRSSSRLSAEPENKPPPQRTAPPSKRKRSSGNNSDNEEHENQVKLEAKPEAKPPSRTTRRSSSSKAPPPVTTSRTSSRSRSARRQVQGSDDEGDDEEPSHPVKKSRPSPELEDVHEEHEEEKPLLDDPPISPAKARHATPPSEEPKGLEDVHEKHEDKSLLDDLPISPAKARHAAPPLEEPKGPHPRLVIHKLVLVNFKSYAGRQEIGPFHKVGCCRSVVSSLISGSLSLQLSGLMALGSRIRSMHCSSCSDIVLPRCGKENSPSSYTTLLNTLICKSAVWRFISVKSSISYVHLSQTLYNHRPLPIQPGPDAFTVVPNSTLAVTRTAYKNNTSKYTINGRASNYKEVQTLLKGRGIDLDHNRFLILQVSQNRLSGWFILPHDRVKWSLLPR